LLRCLRWVDGLVDPHLLGESEGLGWFADKPLGVGGVGVVEHDLAGSKDLLGAAEVHIGRGEQGDPAMVVLVVVPAERALVEAAGVLDRAEPVGEGGVVLEGLELALGVGVVVRGRLASAWPRSLTATSITGNLGCANTPRRVKSQA
jgi:hypothetical protein